LVGRATIRTDPARGPPARRFTIRAVGFARSKDQSGIQYFPSSYFRGGAQVLTWCTLRMGGVDAEGGRTVLESPLLRHMTIRWSVADAPPAVGIPPIRNIRSEGGMVRTGGRPRPQRPDKRRDGASPRPTGATHARSPLPPRTLAGQRRLFIPPPKAFRIWGRMDSLPLQARVYDARGYAGHGSSENV
jgi:hypothetical protein